LKLNKTKDMTSRTITIKGTKYNHGDLVTWKGDDYERGSTVLSGISGKIYIARDRYYILQNSKGGSEPLPSIIAEYGDWKDMGYEYSWVYTIGSSNHDSIKLEPRKKDKDMNDRTINIQGTIYAHGDEVLWGGDRSHNYKPCPGKIYIGKDSFYILQNEHGGSSPKTDDQEKYGDWRNMGYKKSWAYLTMGDYFDSIKLKPKGEEFDDTDTPKNSIVINGTRYEHGDYVIWGGSSERALESEINGRIFITNVYFYILQNKHHGCQPTDREIETYGKFKHTYKYGWQYSYDSSYAKSIKLRLNPKYKSTNSETKISTGKSGTKYKPTKINFYGLQKEITKIGHSKIRRPNPIQGRRDKITIGRGPVRDQKTSIKM